MVIEKGTIIHFNGIPFELDEDIQVLGTNENLKLAKELSDNECNRKGSCDSNP